jgi:NADPH:quinone reductase-like Zn-dependent oxidoreductase
MMKIETPSTHPSVVQNEQQLGHAHCNEDRSKRQNAVPALPSTMKAISANGYGAPEVLQFSTVQRPEPKPNELLVEVVAASATHADTIIRWGKPYFARFFTGLRTPSKPIPGTGFAGKIVAVGDAVTRFQPGTMVFGETAFGFSTNAEYLVVPEDGIVLELPESVDPMEAATFCDGHLTSYNFLTEVTQVQPGQHVLINGASGALGTAAIQIAKHFGAHVTGVCSSRNAGLVRSLGADDVIDYTSEDFTQRREAFDVVYDTIGKSSFRQCRQALKPGGKYLTPVMTKGFLMDKVHSVVFGNKKALFEATGINRPDKLRRLLGETLELVQLGALKTVVDRQFPLEKVAEAHRYIDAGRKRGNVVIVVA